ncbi:MAG: molybdopterin-dependent oxidoreductase, partial [Marinosulfonomonas sp.]|nr:molybdopterin-dependent oxidoreductase [Marinosulfonomonas sp.]
LVGDLAPVEAAFALKQLIEGLGGTVECRTDGVKLPEGNRGAYVGTATIADIDDADMIQLIGTNPAIEAPVLNARIRKAWINGCNVGLVGPAVDLTYDYHHVGDDRAALVALADKTIGAAKKKKTIVIIGQGALREADGLAVLSQAMKLAENTNSKFMVLHSAASRVGAMDIDATTDGGLKAAIKDAEVIYNLGADEVEIADGAFVIYQGSHGDRGAHRADIVLPGAAWTEESGLFVNTEGRPQLAQRAGFAPGEAKENWAVLRALSGELGDALPFNSLAELRRALIAAVPHLEGIDQAPENDWKPIRAKKPGKASLQTAISDFHLTNPIARASALMAELSANAKARTSTKMAAE